MPRNVHNETVDPDESGREAEPAEERSDTASQAAEDDDEDESADQ